jgi:hypothetical protein
MVGPFALFFHKLPHEWREQIEHQDFLVLEQTALALMRREKQHRTPAGRRRSPGRRQRRGG